MSDQHEPVVWDLSDLYSGLDDPTISSDVARLRERAQAFEKTYRGRIATPECTAELLSEALTEYDAIGRGVSRLLSFVSLLFSADTSDPARGAALQKMQQEGTAIQTHLIFFDLEIGRIPEETYAALIEAPPLAPFRHYVEHERTAARHHLSEPEEKTIEELSNTGHRAFLRLFSEITSRAKYRLRVQGEERELGQPELLALLYSPEREVRQAAATALTEKLQEQSHVLTFIFNNLLQHKETMDRLRGYETPDQSRHENNELSPQVVQQMVDVCARNYDIVHEYYRLKRQVLGLDELLHYDRYAPLAKTTTQVPFEEAKRIVLEAFAEFSPELRAMTEPFFDNRWIDAELRPGKRGGAFCSYVEPALHPYVFTNYTGTVRDVMTLAHELGHAIHGVLAGRKQNYLNYVPPLPMAETASVFAELVVFEKLQQQLQDPQARLALLAGKLEDSFATVFRQVTMYRFELQAHHTRRAEGELTVDRYNALWQSTMQEMFGDALRLGDDHQWWWLYIPHMYHTPFYVYAYAFGELLVLALYARYRQEGQPFVQKYFDLLTAGGSQKPHEMLQPLGIDISSPEFWQGGLDVLRGMVEQAKELAAQG